LAAADPSPALEWRSFGELSPALLYEVLRFRQAIFVVEQRSPYADLDGIDQTALHLLLRLDSVLAGCLRLIPRGTERDVRIGRVAVAAEWRGRGLARRMMAAALDRCRRDWPHFRIALSAQAYLVPFYRSLGFAAVSAPYDDCGVPHIDMALVEMALAKPRG
jgi:ElaA protein